MSYAIISVGGKQYRVREGERLLVDRLALEDGATFTPSVLLAGGDGDPKIAPSDVVVTAKVARPRRRARRSASGSTSSARATSATRASAPRSRRSRSSRSAAGKRAAAKQAPAKDKAPAERDAPAGLPEGYADLTVAEIKAAASTGRRDERTAALEYEREHGKRKGAIAALESALAEEGQD